MKKLIFLIILIGCNKPKEVPLLCHQDSVFIENEIAECIRIGIWDDVIADYYLPISQRESETHIYYNIKEYKK